MVTIWKKHITKYPIFSYFLSIDVDRFSFRKKILEVDTIFLKLANQFQLFSIEVSDNYDKILTKYNQERSETFFNPEEEYHYLRFLDFKQSKSMSKKFGRITIFDNSTRKFSIVPNQIDKDDTILNIGATGEHQFSELDDEYSDIKVSMSIYSHSNIWLDSFNYDESRPFKEQGIIDNRMVAYRMTPRLNSFLRDFKNDLDLIGITLIQQECDSRYVTEKGVLLDGKIIYQEDIDEGRIKLPKWNE